MNAWGYVAVGAGLSQVILTAALLSAGHLTSLSRKLYAVLALAVLCFLLLPLGWSAHWILSGFATLIPGAFWLFCASLFDDHYEFPWWQPAVVALSALLPTAWYLAGSPAGGWAEHVLLDLPQAAEFVFLGLALYVIFRSWRDDLITTRRALRIWFCGTLGVFILLLVLARQVLFADAPWLEVTQYFATAVIATGTNMILLSFRPGLLDPVQRNRPAEDQSSHEATLTDFESQLAPVIRLVEQEGIYREWGMTIGKLAAAVDIPEYRLRQLINSGLGYRNFNDFLNRFRIDEASRRLADPAEAKIPVLTIAIESGFRSISTFNKAFKEIHKVTPTVYRNRQLG